MKSRKQIASRLFIGALSLRIWIRTEFEGLTPNASYLILHESDHCFWLFITFSLEKSSRSFSSSASVMNLVRRFKLRNHDVVQCVCALLRFFDRLRKAVNAVFDLRPAPQ